MPGSDQQPDLMGLHLRINEALNSTQELQNSHVELKKNQKELEVQARLLERAFIALEEATRQQNESLRQDLASHRDESDKRHEATLQIIQHQFQVANNLANGLAEVIKYKPEILRRAKSDKWWADGWDMLSRAKGKLLVLTGIAATAVTLHQSWDAVVSLFRSWASG